MSDGIGLLSNQLLQLSSFGRVDKRITNPVRSDRCVGDFMDEFKGGLDAILIRKPCIYTLNVCVSVEA
jgi:hypothetical protein